MLDSSPVALPPARRPLKRSASTASLASLPTPPRTHRKHSRGQSRGSCDSDSDDNAALSTDDEVQDIHKNKKRRTSQVAKDEEAFWLGGPASEKTIEASTAGSSKTVSTAEAAPAASKSQKIPLLYRRMQVQQQQALAELAPVSPPPSHRRSAAVALIKPHIVSETIASPPCTPRTRSATRRAAALLRDSPENPFLVTPQKAIVDDDETSTSADPAPRTPKRGEKPTLTYVFRGIRRAYQNPLYNHAENRPYSPPPETLLPVEHPEYSPPIHCTPKLLFPNARRSLRNKKAAANTRARSPSFSGDELPGPEIRPKRLDFGKAANTGKKVKTKVAKKTKAPAQTLEQEFKNAGEDFFL